MNLLTFGQPADNPLPATHLPRDAPDPPAPATYSEGQAFVSFLDDLKLHYDDLKPVVQPEIEYYLAHVPLWGNQFVYVHDMRSGRFFHKGFNTCLGYALDELTADFFVRNLHPADRSTYFNVSKALVSFVLGNAADLIPFVTSFQMNYRMQKADGTYIAVLRQSTPFIKNAANEVEAYLSFCTDISLIAETSRIHWTILGPKSETFPQYLAEHLQQKRSLFSDREQEILRLIIAGLSSAEMGERLFISTNTVNTHRKSLMRKAGVNKTVDLIAFAHENGYA